MLGLVEQLREGVVKKGRKRDGMTREKHWRVPKCRTGHLVCCV